MDLAQLLESLESFHDFQSWKEAHPQSYLLHFFMQITEDLDSKSNWEIGFFDPKDQKATIFSQEQDIWVQGREDDLFRKPGSKDPEPLTFTGISLDFAAAAAIAQTEFAQQFPQLKGMLGQGFVVLQVLDGTPSWNISLITRKLSMLNCKINAVTKAVTSCQEVQFTQQQS